jgi:hypothetical protein
MPNPRMTYTIIAGTVCPSNLLNFLRALSYALASSGVTLDALPPYGTAGTRTVHRHQSDIRLPSIGAKVAFSFCSDIKSDISCTSSSAVKSISYSLPTLKQKFIA